MPYCQRTIAFIFRVFDNKWEKRFETMAKDRFIKRHGIARNAIKKDLIQFALPGMTVFIIELQFCGRDGLRGFLGTVWGLV